MADRKDYLKSRGLIKEAEDLIRESKDLMVDIKNYVNSKDKTKEIEALKEIIHRLKDNNDNLYLENVLLKSKIRELTVNTNVTIDLNKKSILTKYQNKN